MKKIFYILSIALLGATSCMVNEQPDTLEQVRDGKVTFVMSVQCPDIAVATRGEMAHNPIIDDIYVAVFGRNGYLNDYVKASPCNASGADIADYSGVQNGVLFYYKVTLQATSSQRYIHVIANGPDHLEFKYDYELMPDLTTDAGNGAYWTMFSLPNGTSYKDADGVDQPLESAMEAFRNIKLIRNFAEVTITDNASNFELTGYKVFNTPNKGRVVTWKANYQAGASADQRMDGYYTPYVGAKADDPETTGVNESTPMTFGELQNAGYTPSLAQGAQIDVTAPTTTEYDLNSKYVFERTGTNGGNRPYIILKGKYNNSSTETFYRLDFTDKDGNYIPIFRNFKYDLNITKVAKAGVSDPTQAQPSNANVSALLTTQNLTDLADGQSRIFVQWLDRTFLESQPIKFQYLYLPDATKAIAQANVEPATFKILTNDELDNIVIDEAGNTKPHNTTLPAFTVSDSYATDGTSDWGTSWNNTAKWQEVELQIAAPADDGSEKRTTFRLTGTTSEGDKIFRDVTIHVLPLQSYNASVSYSGGYGIGSQVTVTFALADNLPTSVFPLAVVFEDSNKRLNPLGNDMPAQVGNSIVPNRTERSYQFVKSISYAEYYENHNIECKFKRIATGGTTLYMSNKYFTPNPANVTINAN